MEMNLRYKLRVILAEWMISYYFIVLFVPDVEALGDPSPGPSDHGENMEVAVLLCDEKWLAVPSPVLVWALHDQFILC